MIFKTFFKISISAVIVLGFPSISFGQTAETCVTCGSSPSQLKLLNDFTQEILGTIRTIGTSKPYLGKPVPPSRFNSGRFVAPKQNIISKSLRRAREDVSSVLSLVRIYSPLRIGGMINIADSFVMLMRNQVFLRDWKKLNKMEELINQKKYELSVGGGRTNPIKGVPLQQMQKIITTYQEKKILDPSSKLSEGAQYSDVLVILGSINKGLKHLIAMNSSSWVTKSLSKNKINIKVSADAIKDMMDSYKCARGQKCDSSREKIKKDLKELGNSIKNGSSNSRQQIKDANKKLSTARSTKPAKTNDSPDPETSLLKSIYGLKAQQYKDGGFLGLKNRRSQAQKQKEETKSITQPEEPKDKISSDLQIVDNSEDERYKTMFNNLSGALFDIQADANMANDSAQYAVINDISAYFGDLSNKLTILTKDIIGSKDQDNTLIKNLGDLCSKQCSNISNKKCFY